MTNDPVNHPSHYTFGKYEVADVLDDWFKEDPLLWQTGKYTARAKHKGNLLQDLKKARWYLDRRIEQAQDDVNAERDRTVAEEQNVLLDKATETARAAFDPSLEVDAHKKNPDDRAVYVIENKNLNLFFHMPTGLWTESLRDATWWDTRSNAMRYMQGKYSDAVIPLWVNKSEVVP